MHIRARFVAVSSLLLALSSLQAAEDLISADHPDAILNIAKGYGSAILKKDSEGDPMIKGRIDGIRYAIFFYGCKEGRRCTNIQFSAYWENDHTTLKDINHWNATTRFGKAAIDKDGDIKLTMAVNLKYGVTAANFDETVDWWRAALKSFAEEVVK